MLEGVVLRRNESGLGVIWTFGRYSRRSGSEYSVESGEGSSIRGSVAGQTRSQAEVCTTDRMNMTTVIKHSNRYLCLCHIDNPTTWEIFIAGLLQPSG